MPPPGAATSREAFAKMMTLYAFELTAERYLNDEWVPIRLRNETWDGWIACEVGRESLKPDREELWADQLPEWAVAKPRAQSLGSVITGPQRMYDRLATLNSGDYQGSSDGSIFDNHRTGTARRADAKSKRLNFSQYSAPRI